MIREDHVDWGGCPPKLEDLNALHIEIDFHFLDVASTATIYIVQWQQLAMYDAAFYELAIRHLVPMATFALAS